MASLTFLCAPVPCAFCGTRLHYSADYPVRSQLLASTPPRLAPVPCNFCGTREHFSIDCPLHLQQLNSLKKNYYDGDEGYLEDNEDFYEEEFYDDDIDEKSPCCFENDEYQEHYEDNEDYDDDEINLDAESDTENIPFEDVVELENNTNEGNQPFDDFQFSQVQEQQNGLLICEEHQLESAENQYNDELFQRCLHPSSQAILVQENYLDEEYLQPSYQFEKSQNQSVIEQENLLIYEGNQQPKSPGNKLDQLTKEEKLLPIQLAVQPKKNQHNQQVSQPENKLILLQI